MSVCVCGHPLTEHRDGACSCAVDYQEFEGAIEAVPCTCSGFTEDESATAAREDELREEAESQRVDEEIDRRRGG